MFIPLVFHNLCNYDSDLFFDTLQKMKKKNVTFDLMKGMIKHLSVLVMGVSDLLVHLDLYNVVLVKQVTPEK